MSLLHPSTFKRAVAQTPILGRAVLLAFRAGVVWRGHLKPSLRRSTSWLARSRETTNFTYDLTPLNARYLASAVAEVTGCDYDQIAAYMSELEADETLKNHVRETIRGNRDAVLADARARYARRLGWYAVVRATKPKVVVETGVDKGLGACVLTAALMRNGEEGYRGRYFGTDINPHAGYLLAGPYREWGEILYGDSVQSLAALGEAIDVFVNDSDHSPDYETSEYEAVSGKLADKAILLGDNCHLTDRLLRFALQTGRRFLYFQEQPDGHWYPGAGIGFAFRR